MLLFLLLLALAALSACDAAIASLPSYSISDVTVSGISSGGYMAVQLHVAYSSIVNGSAIFAGGPYYCSEGTLMYAEKKCMKTTLGLPNVEMLAALTQSHYRYGYIDDPLNMLDDRIYLFSGSEDSVVESEVVHSLQRYYQNFVKTYNVVADYSVDAEHCFPTVNHGEACATLSSPYIGNCNFDGAYNAFKTLYGASLNPKVTAVPENLFSFDQTEFYNDNYASLGDIGYIYVPTSCQEGVTCRLHVALHGCLQNIELIGDEFAVYAGYNEWAESNNVIVLYPYAKPSDLVPLNPNGCWDWWGYTNYNYGTQKGVQMQFVRSLIKRVAKK